VPGSRHGDTIAGVPWFRRKRKRSVELPWIELSCGGEYPLEVHGESFHQPVILALVNAHDPQIDGDRIRAEFLVGLAREPDNPHDANAVVVAALSGHALGHIPRDLAAGYSRALVTAGRHVRVACRARAYGRRIGRGWNIGIWLAMPDADDLNSVLVDAIANLDGASAGATLVKRDIET